MAMYRFFTFSISINSTFFSEPSAGAKASWSSYGAQQI
jgi:hypothetical protein